MYAIEFQTKLKNGSIEIPEEYKDKISGTVRVIVLSQENSSIQKTDIIDRLLKHPIEMASFIPLDREEIYDHQ